MKSLQDLRAEVDQKLQEGNSLTAEVSKMREQLVALENRLANFFGQNNENKVPEKSGKRHKNRSVLRDVIVNILRESNGPLTVKEIEELVFESGYETTSKEFTQVVYMCLTRGDEFKRVTRKKTKPARYSLV